MYVIMVMAPFFVTAQGMVGINTSNPRSTLEVNGSLRVDSVNPIKNPKRFAVISDSNTLDYISQDSLVKLLSKTDSSDLCDLDGKVIPELFFSSPGTYMNNCNQWIGGFVNSSVPILITYDHINYSQRRDFVSDWLSANTCHSRIKIGNNIFVMLLNWSTNEHRIYRYSYGSLSSGGILTPLTTQTIPTGGSVPVYLFYDGTYFLLTYKAGNSANQFIISRYSFNGTSLIYIDDVVFIPPANLSTYSIHAIQKSGNFYYIESIITPDEVSVSKYNINGSYAGIEKRFYTTVANSLNFISIGSMIYIYYNFTAGPTSTIQKFKLF